GPTSRPTPPAWRCTSSRRPSRSSGLGTPRPGHRSRFRTRPSPAGSPRRSAAFSPTTWSSVAARSPTTTRTPRPHGTGASGTSTGPRDPTRTRCRTPRSSRRTSPRTSRASTSCERSVPSTHACPAGCTCTSAAGPVTARSCGGCTRRPSFRSSGRLGTRTVNEAAGGAIAPPLLKRFTDGKFIESLLVLHGVHPGDVDTRIEAALDHARPYLGSHAGGVEYLGVDENGVAHLKLEGSCHGCPSSTVTVKLTLEQAIAEAAPEVIRVEVEGVAEAPTGPSPSLIQIQTRPGAGSNGGVAADAAGSWMPVNAV